MSSAPSYLAKNRLGVYILNVRIPVEFRDTNHKTHIQRSLRTRNRREALRVARRMVIKLEDNDFDIDRIDKEDRRTAELFHVGKPLFGELNRLWSEGDQLAIDEFLADLTSNEEEALRYISELNNKNIDQFEEILTIGDRAATADFLADLPNVFKKPLRDILNRHMATHKPVPQPVYSDKEDPTLDVLYEKWLTSDVPSMARSSQSEYKRMVGFFLQVITELNGGAVPRASQLTKEMIRDYKEVVRE